MHHRIPILILNLIFPPLAVMVQTGLTSPETILNGLLYLLAIFPSYVHGFYVSWKCFSREETMERHQWEKVRHKKIKNNSYGTYGSHSSSSSRSRRSSRSQRVPYEVEEFSDQGHELPAGHRYLQDRPPMRRISYVPPPVPDPPSHRDEQRYLN